MAGVIVLCASAADAASISKSHKKTVAAPPPTAFGGRPAGWTVVTDSIGPAATPLEPETAPLTEVASDEDILNDIGADPVIRLDAADGPSLGFGYALLLGGGARPGAGGDSLTCLAQAVYFEARGEPLEGQEAVAQVVLNRTRLPQYPKQVCDVVFQGADRSTGCQFSFTCNGALGRPAESEAWRQANTVAERALAGFTFAPARDATHFHATWVNPYWSGSLTRLGRIGGHIFYH